MILSGHNLTIGYSDHVVGRGLDVALATGQVLALLGPNGGGKTTLLKTLLGLLAPQSGEGRLGDRTLASLTSRERARLIAYVPQFHVATFAFTVEAVVLMGRTAHGNLFSRPRRRCDRLRDAPMPPRDDRLTKLRKDAGREPRTFLLWVDARDTPADIDAKRDRMIAAGGARPDDTFVQVRWKRRDET